MERRFDLPTAEEFSACDVPSALSESLSQQFCTRAAPFGDLLDSDSERYYFHAILEGLAAHGRKNLEAITYAHNHDRQMYQNFVGLKTWAYQPMLNLLAQQVGEQLGDANAVLVLDPTSVRRRRFCRDLLSVLRLRQWKIKTRSVAGGLRGHTDCLSEIGWTRCRRWAMVPIGFEMRVSEHSARRRKTWTSIMDWKT